MHNAIYTIVFLLLPLVFLIKGMVSVSYDQNLTQVKFQYPLVILFALLVVSYIRGISYNTGTDWWLYCEDFLSSKYGIVDTHYEYVFKVYMVVLAKVGIPVFFFFSIFSFLNYWSVIQFSKLFPYCIPLILLMWTPLMFSMSVNIYRQYFAMAIFMLANYYLFNKKFLYALLLCILSVSFHTLMLLMLVLCIIIYLLCYFDININKWIILILVITMHVLGTSTLVLIDSVSAYLSFLFSLGTNSNVYVFSSESLIETQYSASYVHYFLPIHLIWIWFADKIKNKYQNFKFIYYLSCLFFILYPISHQEFLLRLSLLFALYVPFLLGCIYYDTKQSNDNIRIGVLLVSLLPNLFLFIYNFYVKGGHGEFITIFEKGIY